MQALDSYIDEIKTLPPAPRVLTQLIVLLGKDEVHSDQIVKLIALDPALTAKVLQRCNNAASGLSHPVSDLDEGVTRLGFNAIYRLVALVIGEGMLGAEQHGYGLGAGELWEHSVTTAVAAKVISRELDGDENLVFTAGLLHDIGKLVLGSFLEGYHESVLNKTGPSGLSFLEAEKSLLGVDHAEIGGRVLDRWNFPENLVFAVRHHHDPAQAGPHKQLAAYVHLGDIMAHCLGQAKGFDSFAVHARAEALEILELRPREIETLLLSAEDALKEFDGFTQLTP